VIMFLKNLDDESNMTLVTPGCLLVTDVGKNASAFQATV